jgi:uncharacterized protein (DUF2141 family)
MTLRSTLASALVCSAVCGLTPLMAQNKDAAPCNTLEVSGLKPNTGTLEIAAYTGEDGFMKRPNWGQSIKVTDATMRIEFCDASGQEVAFIAFQDLNGNRKLDMNPLGIPSEPYAASGTPPLFSAPTWKDTKVSVADKSASILVKF